MVKRKAAALLAGTDILRKEFENIFKWTYYGCCINVLEKSTFKIGGDMSLICLHLLKSPLSYTIIKGLNEFCGANSVLRIFFFF